MSDVCWQYRKGAPQRGEHAWQSYSAATKWDWEECRHCGQMRNVTPR